jgi:polyisoprenoid-binding protein YceI
MWFRATMSAHESVYAITPSPDASISVEVAHNAFSKKKYLFFFERYGGQVTYDPDSPASSSLHLELESASVVCRDARIRPKEQAMLTRTARARICAPPQITFVSTRMSPKPLRGYVVEGALQVCGITRTVKANAAFGELRNHRIQIDADAQVNLSDFDLHAPSSFFGLVQARDQVLLRILVWGVPLYAQQGAVGAAT